MREPVQPDYSEQKPEGEQLNRARVETNHYLDQTIGTAREFSSIGIRFGYILNGGGLVAIPAIIEFLPSGDFDRTFMVWTVVFFTLGILSAAGTTLVAFFAAKKMAGAMILILRYLSLFDSQEEPNTKKQKSKALDKNGKVSAYKANSYFWIATVLHVLTIVFFILGVFNAVIGMVH